VKRRQSGIPCADGFTAYTGLSLVTGFLATIIRVTGNVVANLTPASGRRDHSALPYAKVSLVSRHFSRPPHPASNVRDDRETPLMWKQDGRDAAGDLPDGASAKAATAWRDGQIAHEGHVKIARRANGPLSCHSGARVSANPE
jgi:hypothetical protein